ncbi:hypothetical protein V6L80_00545 (plasmid) [Erwinia persicina]|uniref:hypothetical protein n=1 Tax=Erwinia persicina TaxID=55211 RepID=UPI0030CE32AB
MSRDPFTPQPVIRDASGCWIHPDFFFPEEWGRDADPDGYDGWLAARGLASFRVPMEPSAPDAVITEWERTGCFARWEPVPPTGEGWFIASVHDTDFGPLCIWLRPVAIEDTEL